jgi:ubiquinone/menaquinone biosynthesis C-methylase UbiE
MNYTDIYDKLYKMGYHAGGKNHGAKFAPWFIERYKFDSVLEVGCSQGKAVQVFKDAQKDAHGVDISPTAIKQAKHAGLNCKVASATSLPYQDGCVDAIYTCDVLEHLTLKDAKRATQEMRRVARKFLFIKVAPKEEKNKAWLRKLKKKFPQYKKVMNLHVTCIPIVRWIHMLEGDGFEFLEYGPKGALVLKK